MRRRVWGEFFARCDGLLGRHAGASARIVHDTDESWRHVTKLLGEHVGTHDGCGLDPSILFPGSHCVNMLQAADIVAYVGRQAASQREALRREFEPLDKALCGLAEGGLRAELTPP